MLSEQELRDMAESIRETGQLNPCVMMPDGLGLDGRNRVAACRIAGVQPRWVINHGNPMSVIIAANVHHRFLSTGQRAMAVAVDLCDKGMRVDGRWKRGSVPGAEDMREVSHNAWRKAMESAGIILDWLPDLADQVLAGNLALDAAYTKAKDKRDVESSRAGKLAELPDDLRALVDAGVRDVDDALQEAQDRRTVVEIDEKRAAEGAPPPTFTERIADGNLSWAEARKLAEEWVRERRESLARDRDRVVKVTDGWAVIQDIAANPAKPYVTALLEDLSQTRRDALQKIINQLNGDTA
jgi:ParB-like chromosome segregation protein Spo0J